MRQSAPRSIKTSTGRVLLDRPDVKGNEQMKTSPGAAILVVHRVLRRIFSHEMLVGSKPPRRVFGIIREEHNDLGTAARGELPRGLCWDGERLFALQFCLEFNGL